MACPWPENNPESLEDLCLKVAVKNIDSFADKFPGGYRLKEGIYYLQHPSLCDKLFQSICEEYRENLSCFLPIFKDPSLTRLTRVNLSWFALNDKTFKILCGHPIRELDLSYCGLDESCIRIINRFGGTLASLILGDAYGLIQRVLDREHLRDRTYTPENEDYDEKYCVDYVFKCPNLRKLVIRDACFENDDQVDTSSDRSLLATILCPLKNLTYLDLSSCVIDIEFMDCLEELKNLLSLDLSCVNIGNMQEALKYICKVKKLRHLDLSGTDEAVYFHNNPSRCLKYVVDNLPHLTSLDISGTNLASTKMDAENGGCCIPGLEGKQLEFLGLLDCPDSPCERQNIPAKRVTGYGKEAQILLALRVYVDKDYLLKSAMNHLFQLLRYEEVHDQCQALELILDGMKRNFTNKQVQISGSAALFYILKGVNREKVTQFQRRRVILLLLDAMEKHKLDKTMLRNVLLNFCSMNLPENMTFCHHRLIQNLMEVVVSETQEDFIQRLGIILLNCIACQVDGEEKLTFGELGAIEAMMNIIHRKLSLGQCDENMEVSWSMMWNITDETAENCRRFIDNDGLELFKRCLQHFPNNEELLRNMMGLMGNIAEVKELRKQLMEGNFLTIFCGLMESEKDGIEVSYNAVGIFSHITADGAEAWTLTSLTREEVMKRMITAIERWPLNSKRNINYRSFGPILNLLRAFDTPAAQYWAVWALCNLTRVYPERYCRLLRSEGGLELLDTVQADPRTLDAVRNLAQTVREQVLAGPQRDIPLQDMNPDQVQTDQDPN